MKESLPRRYYLDRIRMLEGRLEKVGTTRNRIALLRLLAFLLAIISLYLAATTSPVVFLITAFLLAAFLALVMFFGTLSRKKQHLENLLTVNSHELEALDGRFAQFGPGDKYMIEDQPFLGDLDVFGRGSLFQFLNRSATVIGEEFLAGALTFPLKDKEEIRQRQEAVQEISEHMDWCQEFRATGYEISEEKKSRGELLEWIGEPPSFDHFLYRVALILVPILAALVFFLIIRDILPWTAILFYLLVPFSILGAKFRTLNRKHAMLGKKSAVMDKYGRLLVFLEERDFHSQRLSDLKKELLAGGEAPGKAIRKLSRILTAFDNRLNILAGFLLNAFLLWDIRQVIRLESWQKKHRHDLPLWFDVLSETDALCSFGVFRFNYPGSVFPRVVDEGPLIRGKEVHHPLIPDESSVANDIDCPGWKHMTIITGANMAGKSTYLRMAGTALLMAMAGCPVKAREFSFTPVELVSGIRTRDSLQKRESYFYAELKRLKLIIDLLEEGKSLFILLDEVLKGTNSRDKLSGSFALIRKLLNYQVSGMIATHDLALSELEKEYPGNISNRSFEVVIKEDKLEFDYLLKKGVARMMNATFLMEKMGITDPRSDDEA